MEKKLYREKRRSNRWSQSTEKDIYIQDHFAGIIAETEEGYTFVYDEEYLKKICTQEQKLLKQVDKAYLSEEQKDKVKQLIQERIKILSQ